MAEGFDIKITVKKFIVGLMVVWIPILLAYTIEFLQTEEFTPEFEVWVPFIVASIVAIQNYWKHKDD